MRNQIVMTESEVIEMHEVVIEMAFRVLNKN